MIKKWKKYVCRIIHSIDKTNITRINYNKDKIYI